MFCRSHLAHLSVPNSGNKRVLHEGRVTERDGRRVGIVFDQPVVVALGAEVTLYAEVRGKFFQQAATVTLLHSGAEQYAIEFHTVGEPVSAEQRGSYRTGVIAWQIPVRVGTIAGCQLVDVSPEGISVICPKTLTVGTTVDVKVDFEGHVINGPLRVQTAKILPTGKLRFGMFVAERNSPLRIQLQRLSAHMQQAQLKRLSGAA